ncbi:hypothetical protein D3C72_1177810 [compost metagenome]
MRCGVASRRHAAPTRLHAVRAVCRPHPGPYWPPSRPRCAVLRTCFRHAHPQPRACHSGHRCRRVRLAACRPACHRKACGHHLPDLRPRCQQRRHQPTPRCPAAHPLQPHADRAAHAACRPSCQQAWRPAYRPACHRDARRPPMPSDHRRACRPCDCHQDLPRQADGHWHSHRQSSGRYRRGRTDTPPLAPRCPSGRLAACRDGRYGRHSCHCDPWCRSPGAARCHGIGVASSGGGCHPIRRHHATVQAGPSMR